MTAVEFLSQAYKLDQQASEQLRKSAELCAQLPHTANFAAKLRKSEKQIDAAIDAYVDAKAEIVQVICKLESIEEQILLAERYLSFKTWEEIAKELGTSKRKVQNLHRRALQALGRIISGDTEQT